MVNQNKNMYNSILKRKHQNFVDYEFKNYIKQNYPYEYRKAVAETNRIVEKKRIIGIIKDLEESYRKCAKKAPLKLKYAYKILAMHDLLYRLGDEE